MTKCSLFHFNRVKHRLHVISTEAAGVMERSGFDTVCAVRRPDPSTSPLWASLRMTRVRISPDAGDLKSRIDQMRKTREKSSPQYEKFSGKGRKNRRSDCEKSRIRLRKNLRTTNNTTIKETIIETIASPSPSPRSNEAPATLERRAAVKYQLYKYRVYKKKIGTTYVLG